MDFRKIIKFGNSSYVISLPSGWIKKHDLKKGDSLVFEEDSVSNLILYPHEGKKPDKVKELLINVDKQSLEKTRHDLIGAYVNNYHLIRLQGKNIPIFVEDIKDLLYSFVGTEIIEETSDNLVIKDFLKIQEVNTNDLIRKMDNTIRSMLVEIKNYPIKDSNYDRIRSRDFEVNKLNLLTYKIIKYSLNEPAAMRVMKISYSEIIATWWFINYLEKIGDEVKRMADALRKIKISNLHQKEFIKLYEKIEKDFINVMKAYYKKDKELAVKIIENHMKRYENCVEFVGEAKEANIGKLGEKMRGIVHHTKNLAMLIIYSE